MSALPADLPAAFTVPHLLSVAQVAEVLGCSGQTVRRRIAAGSLPAVRHDGRIMVRGDDLRAYVDNLERIGLPPKGRPRRSSNSRRFDFLHS